MSSTATVSILAKRSDGPVLCNIPADLAVPDIPLATFEALTLQGHADNSFDRADLDDIRAISNNHPARFEISEPLDNSHEEIKQERKNKIFRLLQSGHGMKRMIESFRDIVERQHNFLDGEAKERNWLRERLEGVTTELAGVKSELGGVTTELAVTKSELGGVTTELAVTKGELGGVTTELAVTKSELVGVTTELAVTKGEVTSQRVLQDRQDRKFGVLLDHLQEQLNVARRRRTQLETIVEYQVYDNIFRGLSDVIFDTDPKNDALRGREILTTEDIERLWVEFDIKYGQALWAWHPPDDDALQLKNKALDCLTPSQLNLFTTFADRTTFQELQTERNTLQHPPPSIKTAIYYTGILAKKLDDHDLVGQVKEYLKSRPSTIKNKKLFLTGPNELDELEHAVEWERNCNSTVEKLMNDM